MRNDALAEGLAQWASVTGINPQPHGPAQEAGKRTHRATLASTGRGKVGPVNIARGSEGQGMRFVFPDGHEARLTRINESDARCTWTPRRPDFTKREVRSAILPHWLTAVGEFTARFGSASRIIGGAYRN